jgi:ribonuclease BN (tRNA processing enzyme)
MSRDEVAARSKEGYRIARLRVNHPGETYGFSFYMRRLKVVYIPDNEIDPPYEPLVSFAKLVDFCRGADVLIHDSQYRREDMPAKRGWGHSVVDRVREMALEAEVKQLVLFHHDPDRTDAELDDLDRESTAWFRERDPELICRVAYEGLELIL